MDGEITTPVARPELAPPETTPHQRGLHGRAPHIAPSRAKRARWFVIVAVLVALVLGGLYGFNAYRNKMIANFFANNKPPPTAVSAVVAASQVVPHFASGIGSLAAVHQVTITPEVGGRITEIDFKSGAKVKAGDKIIQINDAPDRGDLANFEAQARLAGVTLTRAQTLAAHQYGPQTDVDSAKSQLDQANAQIQKTQAIIAQKEIKAPFSGRLGVRQIDLGQYLNPGAAIVSLTDLSALYVNFTLPSQMVSQIAVGQKVDVTADAFPGRKFTATITTIEPQISASTRTINIQATMPNPDEALLPGMFVNAAVVLPDEKPEVVLPETAVDYTLYGDSVYLIRQDGTDANGKPVLKAHRTAVKTGLRWDDKVAVLDGLKAGDEVVAAGQIKVQDGAAVSVTGNPPPRPPAKLTPQ
ncbi:MAG TPA: efflux RND transporter periplasmic adaptor subunit [Stellaceae bacterium]|jgi:multidrug efflux system membrane fusion protein|nr:efflux RND transporter periplasmic adaptor subunit [Stellaceae bacterium]